MLDLWVLELLAMYATDGRTDRRMDRQKQRLLPLPYGRGHNNLTRGKAVGLDSFAAAVSKTILRHLPPSTNSDAYTSD